MKNKAGLLRPLIKEITSLQEHNLSAQRELSQGQRFLDFVLLLQKQGKRVGLEM